MASGSMEKIVVVGSGVAGLTCALSLIELGHQVTIVTKSQTSDSATWYAQGGVASAMFPDDSAQAHIQDTLDAGAGLCDLEAVKVLVNEGASAVQKLISRGAHFDTLADGSYARTREGGHHNDRIIHAGGDATGEEIERSLVKAAQDTTLSQLRVIDYHMATKILVESNRCVGIECVDAGGVVQQIEASHVVIATGGAGQLFAVTTNPILATADGIALALDAGVLCADLEFMQFHPTALHVESMPRPLLSEALRGEGSILRDENGFAFMENVHPLKDLAPRDVVSKEIARILRDHGTDYVYLDATHLKDFSQRFPTIYSSCESAGIDPTSEFIPVSPAAHYFCGGIVTDTNGATSMPGLWAIGEVACNGVHGANRLASNSLLDGLVFGERAARAIDSGTAGFSNTGVFSNFEKFDPALKEQIMNGNTCESDKVLSDIFLTSQLRIDLQFAMTKNSGVVRTEESLQIAHREIEAIKERTKENSDVGVYEHDFAQLELSHLIAVATQVVESARSREESRGCHTREDFPNVLPEFEGRQMTTGSSSQIFFVPLDMAFQS